MAEIPTIPKCQLISEGGYEPTYEENIFRNTQCPLKKAAAYKKVMSDVTNSCNSCELRELCDPHINVIEKSWQVLTRLAGRELSYYPQIKVNNSGFIPKEVFAK